MHALQLQERGVGLSAATFGVGLSGGRVKGLPATPVTSAPIVVSGIPAGATIEHAYLYWVTYGVAGNSSIKLDGKTLTGALAGQSAGTCWEQFPTFQNFVYRADVSATVDGNGSYVLTGFPSGTATADTQGASLFIVYTDPSDDVMGSVTLFDGAITIEDFDGGSRTTFTNVNVPSTLASATFMVGVGDGEPNLIDAALELDKVGIKVPADGAHYRSSAGLYWDARSYDVKQLLKPGNKNVEWAQSFSQDCLVFAFSALAFRASIVDADGDDRRCRLWRRRLGDVAVGRRIIRRWDRAQLLERSVDGGQDLVAERRARWCGPDARGLTGGLRGYDHGLGLAVNRDDGSQVRRNLGQKDGQSPRNQQGQRRLAFGCGEAPA